MRDSDENIFERRGREEKPFYIAPYFSGMAVERKKGLGWFGGREEIVIEYNAF